MTGNDPLAAPPRSAVAPHPFRGPFNAAFFRIAGPALDRGMRDRKRRVLAGLPLEIVEIGPGVGANLAYLPAGATLVAIEPNPHMHPRLRVAARRAGVRLDLRETGADATGLPDGAAEAVISSLVLCTVADPAAVLAEVRRILRPGGTFRFLEHVVAPRAGVIRASQRLLRRPWTWTFEGCSCERDLQSVIRAAGFADLQLESYRVRSPFLPFTPHIAGVATR